MSLPWGVRKDLDESIQDAYKEYLQGITGQILSMEDGNQAQILKADVKERKGHYMMILRYQLQDYKTK
jgi:hypothetical protein